MFKKAAVFTDLHLGLKGNAKVHNQDCEEFIDWYIAEAKAAGEIMKTSILDVCTPLVPFNVDTECGPSWGELKGVD